MASENPQSALIDQNTGKSLILESSTNPGVIVRAQGDEATGRLLVDNSGGGSGTVTSVSVVTANGFAGSVANATTTPAITLTTTITGVLKGNGTAISAASSSTDYAAVAFKTIAVSGQSDVVADSPIDTLTFVGSGITITTDATTDTITFTGGASGLTVGTTTISSGTTTRVLYDNAGVLGEYVISGSGNVAMTTSPVFTTPTLGVASATSINKVAITAPATGSTLTIADGKTLTVSNTLTFTGTDSSSVNFGAGGTVLYAASTIPLTIGSTTIASGTNTRILYDNSGVLGEYTITGTGTVVAMQTNPTLSGLTMTDATNIILNTTTGTKIGTATSQKLAFYNATPVIQQTGDVATALSTLGLVATPTVLATTISTATESTDTTCFPVFVTASGTQTLAAKTNTTLTYNSNTNDLGVTKINGLTLTASTGTFTLTNAKTLSVTNTLTLSGTDSTTMTFPSTTATIARTDAAQTFTGTQTFSQVITTANAITATSNAATIPVTSRHNIVTNNSAATLTITLTTSGAVNMQTVVVQILDASAAAQTITWVNTENSTVTVPTTSNGSTTLPLTVGFMYNSATSSWRCIAKA